jgi:hypothetical protein
LDTNIPRKGIALPQPNFHIHVSALIYSHDRSAYSAAGNMWTDPGNIWIAYRHMNAEIAAQFPEKEYIKGIYVAVSRKVPVMLDLKAQQYLEWEQNCVWKQKFS